MIKYGRLMYIVNKKLDVKLADLALTVNTHGKSQNVQYDFFGIQKQLINQFIHGKLIIILEIPHVVYRKDVHSIQNFSKIKEQLRPQVKLTIQSKQEILGELTSIPQLKEMLDTLETVRAFLTGRSSGNVDMNLSSYAESLQIKFCSKLKWLNRFLDSGIPSFIVPISSLLRLFILWICLRRRSDTPVEDCGVILYWNRKLDNLVSMDSPFSPDFFIAVLKATPRDAKGLEQVPFDATDKLDRIWLSPQCLHLVSATKQNCEPGSSFLKSLDARSGVLPRLTSVQVLELPLCNSTERNHPVHTYPVGTWNSSESASKCFATHKNGTHLHCSESASKCFATHKNGTHLHCSESVSKCFATHKNGTHLHCVPDPRVTLGPWLAQVHTYPVGTWNSSESASKCFATHKNGTHLHCVPDPRVTLGPWLAQVHTYPVGTWNSSESASKCFATHKNDTHLHCVPDPRVTLGPWLAQVHTYPVGTWNSSESVSKCFATHKNGTHLHCVPDPRVTLGPWLAQVHTYPVGTWNSSESASKCFATHKNGTHLHCVPDPCVTLGPWLAQVHTYPVGTWNSSESASKCFATHKNGTHLHCVPDPRMTLGPWLAQVHTYPVGTWNSSESASKCFATHKNGTHLHWYTPTLWVHGTAQSLPQSALQLTRMTPISTGELESTYELWSTPSVPDPRVTLAPWLAQVHTYPVGTWNSSESASKCFATHKNDTHLHWNSSESASKCFATHKNDTHLHWYTPTLWVHGTAQSLPQSALQLTRMAPSPLVSLKVLMSCGHTPSVLDPRVTLGPWLAQVHTYPVGGYMEQLVRLSSCGHTPSWSSVQDPRVTLSHWLAQVVHIYPVATGTAHNNF
eukprot:Em0001g2834a